MSQKTRPSIPPANTGLRGDAPATLVGPGGPEYGTWLGIPGRANLIDHDGIYHFRLPRLLRNFRLTEWQSVAVCGSDIFLRGLLYDAKFFSVMNLAIWDRRNRKKYGFRHIFPGKSLRIPQSLYGPEGSTSNTTARSHYFRMAIAADPARGGGSFVAQKLGSSGKLVTVDLDFRMNDLECAPVSVCRPLFLNRAMYSCTILMPAEGEILLGSSVLILDANSTTCVLEDHKGFYPHRLRYDGVMGMGTTGEGKHAGFAISNNQVPDRSRYGGNRLWIGNQVHALPPVKITRPYGHASPWVIQDLEGMVDLVFKPETQNDIQAHLGVFDMNYKGPFGSFEGMVKSPEGEVIDASRMYGMGEDESARM